MRKTVKASLYIEVSTYISKFGGVVVLLGLNNTDPELLNVSIRRICLNSRILLNKKIGVNSIYKVIDVYVYLDVM